MCYLTLPPEISQTAKFRAKIKIDKKHNFGTESVSSNGPGFSFSEGVSPGPYPGYKVRQKRLIWGTGKERI